MKLNSILMKENHIPSVQEISELSIKDFWSINELRKELTNKFANYLIFEEDGIVKGFVGSWLVYDELQITNIAVHPNFRGNGIAKSLLNDLIDFGSSKGVDIITLEVRKSNKIAYNLYKSVGFTDEGTRRKFYKDGEDAIIMWFRYND